MKRLSKYLVVFFLLIAANYIGATEPFIRKISYLEGLPTQTIYDLFHDSKGYIYLGTDKGLIRFNGTQFTRIAFKENLSNAINNICEDANGRIWCKNFSNQVFYLENDTLKINKTLQEKVKNEGNIKEFDIDNNTLYIACQYTVFKYDINKNEIKDIIRNANKSNDKEFIDIKFNAKNNAIYVSSLADIIEIKNNKVSTLQNANGQKNISIHENKIYVDYKFSNNKIYNLSDNKIINTTLFTDEKIFINYLRSSGDDLWICSNNGLYRINTSLNKIDKVILPNRRISDVISDHENNIWISTLDEGIFFIPNKDVTQLHPLNDFSNAKLSYTRIVEGPANTIFAGTNLGKIIQINNEGTLLNLYKSIYNSETEFLFFDSLEGKLYHTLGYINIKNQKHEQAIQFGKSLYPDDKGNFIICNYSLAGIIPKNQNATINFSNKYAVASDKYGGIYNYIVLEKVRSRVGYYSPKEKQYYIGTTKGLKIIKPDYESEFIVLNDSIPIVAYDIKENDKGVWVASVQHGLLLIKNNKIIKQYSKANGLSSNNCRKFCYVKNQIWLITDEGIDVINPEKNEIKNISNALSIKGININDILYLEDKIWLATSEGILNFPENINLQFAKPIIYIKKSFAKGNEIHPNSILNYSANDIDIHFDVIHYKSQGNAIVQYRLLGYDSLWQTESVFKNSINYLSLAPGNYTLQIQALADDSLSGISEFSFTIKKPFWLSWWFISLAIFIGVYILYLVYQLAVKRTRKQELIKEKLALSQLTALRSQMNPHFLFNVLNAVQGLIYANKKNDATEYLGKFSDLMRKTLEHSDKQEISLTKELETLKIYIELEAARFDNDFNYQLNVSSDINTDEIKIPSMIIQPYVENAIKHGLMHKRGIKKLNISIQFTNSKNAIEVLIDDNGIGREASKEINMQRKKHQSFATAAIESRVKLLNKILEQPITIEIIDKKTNDNIATGTYVKIIIPIKNE
jgi:ligand-binding sensor domain-containing protein/anti-sigma regulatory factor (Ser/Thr protein kinase)